MAVRHNYHNATDIYTETDELVEASRAGDTAAPLTLVDDTRRPHREGEHLVQEKFLTENDIYDAASVLRQVHKSSTAMQHYHAAQRGHLPIH